MFLALLKKELKQFFRSKGDLIMLFVFPIVLISVLSVGLEDIMKGNVDVFEDNVVYYNISESIYEEGFNMFKSTLHEEYDVVFKEAKSVKEAKKQVDNRNALIYISIDDEGYSIYRNNSESFTSRMFRSVFQTVMDEYGAYNTIAEYNPKQMANLIDKEYDSFIEEESGQCKGGVSSAEYYTFAELALIILYISTTVSEHMIKEHELTTIDRVRMSKAKEYQIIFSKASLGIIIGIIQVLLVYVYSSVVLKVDWGENTLKFFLLFFNLIVFSSVLGVVLGLIIKKSDVLSGLMQSLIIIMCALGGSYIPIHVLISSPICAQAVKISPIYWINMATSTLMCGYESKSYEIALIIPLVLSVIMILLYLVIHNRKSGEKNA